MERHLLSPSRQPAQALRSRPALARFSCARPLQRCKLLAQAVVAFDLIAERRLRVVWPVSVISLFIALGRCWRQGTAGSSRRPAPRGSMSAGLIHSNSHAGGVVEPQQARARLSFALACCGSTTPPASKVEWIKPADMLPRAVTGLLRLAADYYLPFLAANNEAFGQGDQEVVVTLTGQRYAQAPFRYQVKCYDGLRKKFAALPTDARKKIEPVLAESGMPALARVTETEDDAQLPRSLLVVPLALLLSGDAAPDRARARL